MNTTSQPRARAGGETGLNGEWYEGGKFLPSTEDRPKTAPGPRHELTAEEQARRDARKAADDAEAARINAWLDSRRIEFGGLILQLRGRPLDSAISPERWAEAVKAHAAGFYPSLGQTLWVTGSLSPKQAQYVAKFAHGRRTKANAFGFDGLINALTAEFPERATS